MFNVEVHVTNRVESNLVRLCIRFLLTLAIGALTFGNSTSFAGNISCLELLNKLERFQSSSGSPLNSVFKLMEANKRKISTNSLIRIQSMKEALHKKYSPMLVEIEQTEDFSSRDSLLNIVDLAVRLDLASAVTGQSLSQDQVDTLISAHIYGRPPYSAHDLKAKINILKRSFPQQVINDFLRLGITGEGEISLSRDNVIVTSPTTSHQDSHLSGVNSREAFERAKTLPLESFLRGPAKTLAPLFTREVYPESQTLRVKGPGNGAVVTIDLEFRDDPQSPGSTIITDRVERSANGVINAGHYALTRPVDAITDSFIQNPKISTAGVGLVHSKVLPERSSATNLSKNQQSKPVQQISLVPTTNPKNQYLPFEWNWKDYYRAAPEVVTREKQKLLSKQRADEDEATAMSTQVFWNQEKKLGIFSQLDKIREENEFDHQLLYRFFEKISRNGYKHPQNPDGLGFYPLFALAREIDGFLQFERNSVRGPNLNLSPNLDSTESLYYLYTRVQALRNHLAGYQATYELPPQRDVGTLTRALGDELEKIFDGKGVSFTESSTNYAMLRQRFRRFIQSQGVNLQEASDEAIKTTRPFSIEQRTVSTSTSEAAIIEEANRLLSHEGSDNSEKQRHPPLADQELFKSDRGLKVQVESIRGNSAWMQRYRYSSPMSRFIRNSDPYSIPLATLKEIMKLVKSDSGDRNNIKRAEALLINARKEYYDRQTAQVQSTTVGQLNLAFSGRVKGSAVEKDGWSALRIYNDGDPFNMMNNYLEAMDIIENSVRVRIRYNKNGDSLTAGKIFWIPLETAQAIAKVMNSPTGSTFEIHDKARNMVLEARRQSAGSSDIWQ
jgi:uncharacterized protein YaiE (UPF0345 family)